MWFTRVSIKNPVFATMMMAAFLVLGLFSYFRLPVEQFPDVNFPVVVVQTEYPGAAPETVESDLTRKIEEAVNTVSGVKQLSSRSYEGMSVVIAEFLLTVDPAAAAQDVREKVAVVKPAFRKEVKSRASRASIRTTFRWYRSRFVRRPGRRENSRPSPTRWSGSGSRTFAASAR